MTRVHFRLAFVVVGLIQAAGLRADVRLPAIFSDHMVLQREVSVPVWGWAEAGEQVSVSFDTQNVETKADTNGKWLVKLANLKAGGPQTLTVTGKDTLAVKDGLGGEVWLGSGQSNMALQVARAKDVEKEAAASNLPGVRMFTVSSGAANSAQEDCKGSWVICTPQTVRQFSAALFFLGREIHKEIAVPVGLIHSSVGGTPIESWISPEAQHASAELKPL